MMGMLKWLHPQQSSIHSSCNPMRALRLWELRRGGHNFYKQLEWEAIGLQCSLFILHTRACVRLVQTQLPKTW